MTDADRERWDARYETVGVGEPRPPSVLDGRADVLPDGGRALELACGRGTVAVWLAQRGFTVDAVDVSAKGLAAGCRLAERIGVGERIRWVEADLDTGLPLSGPYDVVVCERFRAPELYPDLTGALAPAGLLVMTVLCEVGDSGGSFRATPGELAAAFGALEVLAHEEANGEANLVARAR